LAASIQSGCLSRGIAYLLRQCLWKGTEIKKRLFMQKKYIKKAVFFLICFFLLYATAAAKNRQASFSGKPGTYEDASRDGLSKVISLDRKLKPADDEFVVYYIRPDKDYSRWALWMWAIPGGDGNSYWKYTQNWKIKNGIGYMRFHLDGRDTGGIRPVSAAGTVGLIVRQKEGWIKDCNDDRFWDIADSHKIVIFSGDQNTYAAEPYRPSVKSAELTAPDEINLVLSGKYGIAPDGSSSGFTVTDDTGNPCKIKKIYNTKDPENMEKNMIDTITIKLAENADVSSRLTVSNPVFRGSSVVNSTKLAVKLAEKAVPFADTVLGCTYKNGSAVFNLWAPTSSDAVLNLYKNDAAADPDYTVLMTKNDRTGVWSAVFAGADPDGMFYDFTLQNAHGTVTVLDPYAKSMAAYLNKGGAGRAAVIDIDSAKAFPSGGMDALYVKRIKREDAVIYEISIRDFTISPDSDVETQPGTYKAFIEKIPYLKSLGITHVQLMPVLNFYNNDETNKAYENSGTVSGNNYNWGYDPHNYFTPEGWYATDAADPYCRVRELRELVNECHKAGIGVILDVVYNHMASTRFLDDIVPGYYFRTDEHGKLKSASGCGNDTATERRMMKKLVVDSASYWVKNYKVDGFRFDIMGLMESSSVLDSYEACAKLNPSVLFEGEGWKLYNGPAGTVGMDQNYMAKTDSVAVFNDEFRDLIKAGGLNETGRGFITNKGTDEDKLFSNCIGKPVVNYRADNPGDNLQYLVCHDGLTLHDGIVHNMKLDENKPEEKAEIIKRIKLGNFFELTSQGIAFLHAGQERGRTKPNSTHAKNECLGTFVRNSYDSADNINQFVWKLDDDYEGLLEYTKGLIALRRAYEVFRMDDAGKLAENARVLHIGKPDGLLFGYSIKDAGCVWFILVNGRKISAEIDTGTDLTGAVVYADGNSAGAEGLESPAGVSTEGTTVKLDALTAAVLRVIK
jgi:pullulanase